MKFTRRGAIKAAAIVGSGMPIISGSAHAESDETIDIQLYHTQQLKDNRGDNVLEAGQVVAGGAYNSLNSYQASVRTRSEPVPIEESDDLYEMYDEFGEWIENSAPDPATDSNALLVSAITSTSGLGYERCNSCPPELGNTCIVSGAGAMAYTDRLAAFYDHGILGVPAQIKLVHEIGHNLGLSHSDGDWIEIKQDHLGLSSGDTLVSPMIGSYALEDNGIGPNVSHDKLVYSSTLFDAERDNLVVGGEN